MLPWQQLIANITLPLDWVGIRAVSQAETILPFRDGLPQTIGKRYDRGFMVEVLAGGHYGYSSTNQVTEAGFRQAVEGAYRQAIGASPWRIHNFRPRPPPKAVTNQR